MSIVGDRVVDLGLVQNNRDIFVGKNGLLGRGGVVVSDGQALFVVVNTALVNITWQRCDLAEVNLG